MKDCREEWYDATRKVAMTVVDVTAAAQTLAAGHLCGPTSAHCLAEALAAAALLGAEMSDSAETLILQMKCSGPLGGYNVECTAAGTLRGYTEKKILDEFDATALRFSKAGMRKILGDCQVQVTRSVPGRILSQGISNSLDGYLAGSLQRRACVFTEASVTDEVEVSFARGVLVEALPDSGESVGDLVAPLVAEGGRKADVRSLAIASRALLGKLGLGAAELRKTAPLSFACRCSPERAAATLAALSAEERAGLPRTVDVTCHMCGRTFTVGGAEQ